MSKKLVALALIAILATAGGVYAATTLNLTIPTNINVLAASLDASPASIVWGNVTQGATITRQITLTNNSTTTTQPLNLTTATDIGTVTWNAEGITLAPGLSTVVIFTLQVADNASVGASAFPLYIKG